MRPTATVHVIPVELEEEAGAILTERNVAIEGDTAKGDCMVLTVVDLPMDGDLRVGPPAATAFTPFPSAAPSMPAFADPASPQPGMFLAVRSAIQLVLLPREGPLSSPNLSFPNSVSMVELKENLAAAMADAVGSTTDMATILRMRAAANRTVMVESIVYAATEEAASALIQMLVGNTSGSLEGVMLSHTVITNVTIRPLVFHPPPLPPQSPPPPPPYPPWLPMRVIVRDDADVEWWWEANEPNFGCNASLNASNAVMGTNRTINNATCAESEKRQMWWPSAAGAYVSCVDSAEGGRDDLPGGASETIGPEGGPETTGLEGAPETTGLEGAPEVRWNVESAWNRSVAGTLLGPFVLFEATMMGILHFPAPPQGQRDVQACLAVQKVRLQALDGIRVLGAAHLVAFHLYQDPQRHA
ncbi:hypothetical protein CYMTET_46236 [Cymbomonas tetramitiformis]|uniref:Uncharacterized protein n=1 Tax=Cymbomonas tetramitiformis TaxID=36881 RepID=A0AAE0BWJ0_9CHLO|nr:hypothetical protein CYMTET_46236 [Cymbomonas tetramitiformis]